MTKPMKTLFILFTFLLATDSFANNPGVSYQGRIFKPDGSPLEGTIVQFRMQVRSPGSENCLLYEEVQTLNMAGSSGVFSVTMNDGTGTRLDTATYQVDRIFANRDVMTLDTSRCAAGTSYTPNVADGRKLVVYFKDETMAAYEAMPIMNLNYVPQAMYALEAQKVGTFAVNNILRAVDGSGNPVTAPALDPTQLTNLTTLLAGTSTQYATATQFNTVQGFAKAAPPTCGANEVLKSNGTTLSCVTDSAGGSPSYSGITAATATNTIDNLNFAQAWNWSTATTQSPMSMSANALTTGSAMNVSTSSASLNSTNGLLNVANTGASTSGILARFQSNSTAGSGLTVLSNGNVGIGTATPNKLLTVKQSNDTDGISIYGFNLPTYGAELFINNSGNAVLGASVSLVLQASNNGGIHLRSSTAGVKLNDATPQLIDFNNGQMRVTSAGSVGIGTTAPTGPLHVLSSSAGMNVIKGEATGSAANGVVGTAACSVCSGVNGLSSNVGGYGVQATNTGGGFAFYSGGGINYFAGNVGIGTTSPQTTLQVAGVISPATNNTYTLGNATYRFTEVYATNGVINTSDRREKKDIYNTDLGLSFINKLRPVSYRWNTGVDDDVHYGLIAQEAEQVLAEIGKTEKTSIVTHDETTDRYGVRYSELISPLIKSVQELYNRILGIDREIASVKAEKADKAEVNQLKSENEKLKQENTAIKAYLCSKDKKAPICK